MASNSLSKFCVAAGYVQAPTPFNPISESYTSPSKCFPVDGGQICLVVAKVSPTNNITTTSTLVGSSGSTGSLGNKTLIPTITPFNGGTSIPL